jgi:hypothetical protein
MSDLAFFDEIVKNFSFHKPSTAARGATSVHHKKLRLVNTRYFGQDVRNPTLHGHWHSSTRVRVQKAQEQNLAPVGVNADNVLAEEIHPDKAVHFLAAAFARPA